MAVTFINPFSIDLFVYTVTGGTVTIGDTQTTVDFLVSGSINVTVGSRPFTSFVVGAGGGTGGSARQITGFITPYTRIAGSGGGGAAYGTWTNSSETLSEGIYNILVGGGGACGQTVVRGNGVISPATVGGIGSDGGTSSITSPTSIVLSSGPGGGAGLPGTVGTGSTAVTITPGNGGGYAGSGGGVTSGVSLSTFASFSLTYQGGGGRGDGGSGQGVAAGTVDTTILAQTRLGGSTSNGYNKGGNSSGTPSSGRGDGAYGSISSVAGTSSAPGIGGFVRITWNN